MSNHQKRGTDDNPPKPNPQQEESTPNNANDGPNPQSLASRIQNSASGLARNAFFSSTSSGDTAQLLSDGSKAAPSQPSSALAAAERYKDTSGPSSSSSVRDQTSHTPSQTFRSSATEQTGAFILPALTEDEFQRSYGEDWSSAAGMGSGKGKGKEILTSSRAQVSTTNETPLLSPFEPTTITTNSTLPSDGDAVVALLSNQTFDPDFPPSADEPHEYIDTELRPPQLTPEEIQMIELFRRQLPPSPNIAPSAPQQLTSLSLVPDIGSFLDTMPSQTSTEATVLRDTVLTSLPGATDWVSVEERYHDEVWGYLQPALKAAAQEIESKKDLAPSEDGPAVRRLKMILKHMQA